MEEALRQSEERFRAASRTPALRCSARAGICAISGVITPISDGRNCGQDPGRTPRTAEAASDTKVRLQVLETGIAARAEMRIAYGGRKHYYDVAIDRFLDFGGRRGRAYRVRIDVTELRETTEALREPAKAHRRKLYLSRNRYRAGLRGNRLDGASCKPSWEMCEP